MKKWWLGVLWLGCSAFGLAQDWSHGQLPASTQVYVEYRPQLRLNDGLPVGERLRRSPLFRVFSNLVGLSAEKADELGAFPFLDGRFLLAVTRQGDLSPFEAYHRAEKKQSRLRDLRYAAEQAFEGINLYRKFQKKFPRTITDLSSKEYFDEALIPEGARLEIRRDGKSISVVGTWEDLEVRWPDSGYRSGYSLSELGGLVVGLGCPDSNALSQFLQKWDPELEELSQDGDHWKFHFDEQDYHLYVHKGWLYFTNQPALADTLRATAPPALSLRQNPRFAEQVQRLTAPDTEAWVFADLQDILRTSPRLCEAAGWSADKILVRSLALSSGSHLDPAGRIEVQARGFLQWDGVQNVTLGPPSAQSLARRIPSLVETVYWVDLPGWIRVVDRLAGEFPGVSEAFNGAWGELEKRLGFSLPRESLASGTQLYVYAEVVDSYANQLEMLIKMVQGYLGGNSPDLSEALQFNASKVPVMAVLEVANPDLARKVETRLKERLGASPRARKVENVSYSLSEDGRCGWASSNTTQFWANGYTERLLPRVKKTYQGGQPTLAEESSYRWFEHARQGELLYFQHTKVDREYSLIKGLLLYLGSDFRPEAEKLGRLRDLYTAVEVVPGGVSLRASVYSEGVPAPVITAPEGEGELEQ